MTDTQQNPATLFDDYDRFEQAKVLLLLGWAQQDIAKIADVSEGTVSKYHQQMAKGEAFPPSKAYQLARRYLRRLDKAGFDISEAENILEAIDELRTVDIAPTPEADTLSAHEVAELTNVATALYDGDTDKHSVATRMSELLEITDESSRSIELNRMVEHHSKSSVPSMSEIAPERDAETQEPRTMSEAVTQKGEMLR